MADPAPRPARRGRRADAIWRVPGMTSLTLVTVAGFGGFAALFPVVPLWVVQGGQDAAGAGLVNGTLLLATIATQPFVPRVLARFGAGWSLVAALLMLGVPALALGVSDGLGWALGMSAFRGVGFGILTVTGSAVVADLVPVARRGEAIGFYGLGIAVPNLVLLPASVAVAENVGFWLVFALGALPVLGVPAALALGRTLDASGPGVNRPAEHSATPWRQTGGVVAAALVLLAATLSGGALMTFLPQLTGSSTVAFVALLVFGLVAALGRWRVGRVADRMGANRLLLPLLLTVVAGLLLAALALAHGGRHASTALLLVAVVVVGIGYGTLQNLTLVVAFSRAAPGDHGRASAIWNVGFDGGTALGAVLFGFVATNAGFAIGFLVLGGLAAAALPLTVVSRKA